MDDFAALRLQMDWGADEALDDTPVDRMVARAVSVSSSAPVQRLERPTPAVAPIIKPAAQRAQEIANAAQTLDELREAMLHFDGCPLAATATQLVFSDGNPESGLMLIGESPGADEDRIGKPFVGPSGQFLDRMLASVGLDRTQCLMTYLVPWRPPGNRSPTETEIQTCLPFLLRHIALVRPQRLVLIGAIAAQAILGSKIGITRLRGNWGKGEIPDLSQPIPALPMLHPAHLLNNTAAKREGWKDIVALRRHLDSDPQ